MLQEYSNSWLIDQIEQFITKYYSNKLLKGLLIVSGCVLLYLLLLVLGESVFYFKPWFKIPALLIPAAIAFFALIRYVIYPLMQMFRLGKRMSNDNAAKIIGTHFSEIEDKLLNILQLQSQPIPHASRALIEASIQQKSQELSPFRFSTAVNFRENKKWLPLALIPVIVGCIIYFLNPGLITGSGSRLMNVNAVYAKPAPFEFRLLTKELAVAAYSDLPVKVALKGKSIPASVNIVIGSEVIPMNPEGKNTFSYTIRKVNASQSFRMEAAGYYSDQYTVNLLYLPELGSGVVRIKYPSYTGRENETIDGLTDLTVPEGAEISWEVNALHTSEIVMNINDTGSRMLQKTAKKGVFGTSLNAAQDFVYALSLRGEDDKHTDAARYTIRVVKDQAPQINVKEVKEKISGEQVVLSGNASDDYGLSKAYFVYKVTDARGKPGAGKSIPLTLSGKTATNLEYYFDIATLSLQPGERVAYYMEVWDNDAVNGSKSARSQVFEFKTVKKEESGKAIEENAQEMSKSLAQSKENMEKMKEQLQKMQENTLKSKEMTEWEQKQNLDVLQNQQEVFKEQLDELEKRMELQKELMESKEYNEQIREKQEAIEQQIENLAKKELNEQMQRLQELLQRKNGQMNMQDLQQMQEENKLFQMDMERIEEMIKQLEAQMKMEDIGNRLEQMAEDQEKLIDKTSENTSGNEQLRKEQEDLKSQLDKLLKEDMQQLKDLADDKDFSEEQKLGEEGAKDMQESSEQLNKQNNGKSKEAQQQARNKLKQMAAKMKEGAAGMDMEQIELDIKATRQLLTNLLRLSFDQEDLMNKVRNTSTTATAYTDYVRSQHRLVANASMIKDSLFALSKRVVQLGPTINRETAELERRLQEAVRHLEARQISPAAMNQQYVMTSSNNLALMLNELLSNLLQSQASGQGEGKGQGKGQGKGKGQGQSPGGMMKDIITGQQKMGKGLQQLQQEGSQGQNGKQGQNGQSGQSGQGQNGEGTGGEGQGGQQRNSKTAEMLSRMAYEQAKLRQQLQQLNSIMNSKGIKGNAQLMREIQEKMDRLETDLINRNVNDNLMQRQQEILTRLLKAEESIREQEEDNKRQGEKGIDKPRPIPPELQKYLEEQRQIKDMYRTAPPRLRPFYKKLSEKYLDKVNT